VDWVITHAEVTPADASGPVSGDNVVRATIRDVVTLGDDLHVRLAPDAAPAFTLHMKLSRHAVPDRAVAPGLPLTVRLTPSAIVTMTPGDDTDAGGRHPE
jgi:hypothetical protein